MALTTCPDCGGDHSITEQALAAVQQIVPNTVAEHAELERIQDCIAQA